MVHWDSQHDDYDLYSNQENHVIISIRPTQTIKMENSEENREQEHLNGNRECLH